MPLRLSANLVALNAGAVADLVQAGLVRAGEMAAFIPATRRKEYEQDMADARAALAEAQKITGGATGISSHDDIVTAAGHFGNALAKLAAVGNIFRQSLEANDNPATSALSAKIVMLERRVSGQGRFPYAGPR
nr:hypothetical protein [Dechloromonas sp.]